MAAARLILDRIVPVRRGRAIHLDIDMKMTDRPEGLVAAMTKAAAAMAAGHITPDEAKIVADVLDAKRRAIEIIELDRRIERLEESISGPAVRFESRIKRLEREHGLRRPRIFYVRCRRRRIR